MWGSIQGGNSSILYQVLRQVPVVLEHNISTAYTAIEGQQNIVLDPLAIPTYATVASIVLLLVQLVSQSNAPCGLSFDATCDVVTRIPNDDDHSLALHIKQLGGYTIFSFKLLRLLLSVFLFALSIVTVCIVELRNPNPAHTDAQLWTHIGECAAYAYTSFLAFISIISYTKLSRLVTRHVNLVLLTIWTLYIYRDVWPLATFTLTPADIQEGFLLWAKLSVLTLAAVVVPLCTPRQYIPLNAKEPMSVPSPEQTASILSMTLYTWLDSTVITANRMGHLPADRLPPMADCDLAKNLIQRSFPHMDPFQVKNRRHIFWGLTRVFQTDLLVLALTLAVRTAADFAHPIAINFLLNFVENDGRGAVARPWVWIACLFLGPSISSMAFQWYTFISMRMMARIMAIITQLVFDHALRARVKANVQESAAGIGESTVVPTPESSSVVGHSDSQFQEQSNIIREGEEGSTITVSANMSPTKGKQKADDDPEDAEVTSVEESKNKSMVGRITNLISTDLNNITEAREFLYLMIEVPFKVIFSIYVLYTLVGWSAFAGMAITIVSIPLQGYCASFIQSYQVEKMNKTDARAQAVTDVLGVVRMVKLFGWEPQIEEQLAQKRDEEMNYQLRFRLISFCSNYAALIMPLVTLIVTFVIYTAVMKQELTAGRVFASIALLDMLRNELMGSFYLFPETIAGKVSLDRVTSFLYETELLDAFSDASRVNSADVRLPEVNGDSDIIGIRNASFTWTDNTDGSLTPGRRNYVLHIDGELIFRRGHINLIIGPTGCGKTSMLMALLGEMHYMPSAPDSFVRLPRAGGIAYAAQESWVLSETIRDNILFGAPFDEERYNKVIHQCGLERDLSLLDAGDKTEVGEKGLTLSGGQKARITLARAVYSSANILLLDDVLAALDVHTARWIIDKCFKGDLLCGRTVILVTHNVALASPISEYAVSLGLDGRIHSQGSLSKALEEDSEMSAQFVQENRELRLEEDTIDEPRRKFRSLMRLAINTVSMFATSAGGRFPSLFWLTCLGMYLLAEIFECLQPWFLGLWAHQYKEYPMSEISVPYYVTGYSILVVANVLAYSVAFVVFLFGTLRAARIIHKILVNSVLGATFRWLDMTPTSRILSRCTEDINAVDGVLSQNISTLMSITAGLITRLAAVLVMSPIFTVPAALLGAIGGWCGRLYAKAQLSVKRELGVAHAPVLDNFNAAISGLTSIRAYGAEEAFRLQGYERMDRYMRTKRTVANLHRWVCIRIEILGALFSACLAAYLVYGSGYDASNIGYTLNMSVAFSSMILWWTLVGNQTEVSANSLERIHQYTVIEQESEPTKAGVPPAYWPSSGALKIEHLSARYSPDGPRVLHDISFDIRSGEHIGIVGRIGSGKSSLTLVLLRCILTEGKVYYDGIPTDSINLDALRSNITIIPQVPELLSGTLRANLDPFSQHDDAELNDALRAAGLFSLQTRSAADKGLITLDTQISSAGGNLSVGQRQILALARAIIRRSKLLILDEATSAIDYETDTVIQTSLRKELSKDVTLLTIAHRLQTIMDADRIMVLDAGHIMEFDTPSELLKNEKGMFRSLVDGSGDKERLYALAAGGRPSGDA